MRTRALMASAIATLSLPATASSHWAPQIPKHNLRHAVNLSFCGHSNSYCGLSSQAMTIIRCETGGTFDVWAGYRKHDYWGLYQFGSFARATYGFGWNPWKQSRAAYRYYRDSGWHPWECAYLTGIL